jgi:hypothetical protein
MRTITPLAAALAALVLAGCGSAAVSGGSTAPQPPDTTTIAHPVGSDEVVLQVSTGGGFVAPATNLRALPSFTLLGDGTVLVPAAIAEIFPGPAVAPISRARLTEDQVQQVLVRAGAAGLLDAASVDYGDMGAVGIADVGTTTLTIQADGATFTRSAYALGMDGAGTQLSAAQSAARAALTRFLSALPTGGDAVYVPASYTVFVGPATGTPQAGAAPVLWPLAGDLATIGTPGLADYRCLVVAGADAATLGAALAKANEQTQWLSSPSGNATFSLVVRPGIPGDPGCVAAP